MSLTTLGLLGRRALSSPLVRRLLIAGGVALIVVLAIIRFYNWAENNGGQTIRTEVVVTTEIELRRQITVLEQALRDASARAAQSAELNRELERQVDEIVQLANDQDRAARNDVCVPSDIADRLRGLE